VSPFPSLRPRTGGRGRVGACAIGIVCACSGSGSNNPWASSTADGGTGDETRGGGEHGGTTSTTNGDGDASESDPKFDVLLPDLDLPDVMPTCHNLEEFGITSMGCEFLAIDFEDSGPLGVGIGNPWDVEVEVLFEDRFGPDDTPRVIGQRILGPRSSEIVRISQGGLVSGRPHKVWPNWHNEHVAIRVTADLPITAMQISPMGGSASWVPEASMLLPRNAFGLAYFGLSYQSAYGALVAIAAIEDETTVTTPDGATVLSELDVLSVFVNNDATGTSIVADKPVAVFSGNHATNVPVGRSWSDHLQEQLLPLAAWGTKSVGARHPPRRPELGQPPETVVWRVVAAKDDTTISFIPPQPEVGAAATLAQAGDFREFASTVSFVAESASDKPFMLVQYMTGGEPFAPTTHCMPGPATGDPLMIQMVPTDQWLARLPFLTDTSYGRDFVVIAREAGTPVNLACFGAIPDARFEPIPGTPYEVASIDLDVGHMGGEGNCEDGAHFIEAGGPVGVIVGGVDCASSYGYPGGMSLEALWTPAG
jgi:hypothetical protein